MRLHARLGGQSRQCVFGRSYDGVDLRCVDLGARWLSSCGWLRAGAANVVLAVNDVHDRCGPVHVNIRAHKDMRSEYVGETAAYGTRGARLVYSISKLGCCYQTGPENHDAQREGELR